MIKTERVFKCRDRELILGSRTLCMGILNITPDSFSDGGVNADTDTACKAAEQMVKDGADILDIGGESTRPGYVTISDDEEINRIVPVIEKIKANLDVAISVDTYKPAVLRAALEAGAHITNDITGFLGDTRMADITKEYGAGAVLMFNCRTNGSCDGSIIDRAISELEMSIDIAHKAGISDEYIMTDPGIGFGTTREQDKELIRKLNRLSFEGRYPVLLAGSRKRLVAELMGRESVAADRDAASVALALSGINNGADVVRVHNVRMTVDAIRCYEGLIGD